MKYVEIEDLEKISGKQLKPDETFSFRCHPDIGCFNQCCRNLNLFLYPYDVVRLKQNLGMGSDQFLDQYVDVVLRSGNFFPDVLLKMTESTERTCPFLTPAGCTVYPDRPDACRTFPVEQGAFYDAKTNQSRMIHFFRPPDFCMGQHEDQQWTPVTWAKDQDAEKYHQMTLLWSDVRRLFQTDPWQMEGPEGRRAKMAFMATYNMDRFSEFVFNSSFLKRYRIKPDLKKKLKNNEAALLKFGFEWVKFFLWGMPSKQFKPVG